MQPQQATAVVPQGAGAAPIPVGVTQAAVPRTGAELRALRSRRTEISDQIQSATSRRNNIANQLKEATDPAIRSGLTQRLLVLDNRIAKLEQELETTGEALRNTSAGVRDEAAGTRPEDIVNRVVNDLVPIVAILSVFVFAPMALAMSRFIWRRAAPAPKQSAALPDPQVANRLDQLQQAVDTIAIEVERISEGQRFVTKVLSDRAIGPGEPVSVPTGRKAATERR